MVINTVSIIEYSDFPDDVAESRDAEGELVFGGQRGDSRLRCGVPGARAQTERYAAAAAGARRSTSARRRERVKPSEPNALKFERFIFDLLPHERPTVIEYAEAEAFAPLKNASGRRRTRPSTFRFLLEQHRRWLEAAGAEVAPGVQRSVPCSRSMRKRSRSRVKPGTKFHQSQPCRGRVRSHVLSMPSCRTGDG